MWRHRIQESAATPGDNNTIGIEMITLKVTEYREKMRVARHKEAETRYANLFWDELFDNCKPTKDEFVSLTNDALVTPSVFWRLVKNSGFWE